MGIINGVEANKKWLMVFGGQKQRYVSKPTEFYPVSDTECFNCCEVILQDGSVINEVMYWKSSDGEHIDEWRLFGNPLAYKKASDDKFNKKYYTKFEAVYPSSSVPAWDNKTGTRSAADIAKFCHDNFAKGDVWAIVGVWADDVVHAVANRTAEIIHSGVYFGKPQGIDWLKSFAMAGVKYKLLETHPVNDCLCFTISECTYSDGSKGQECMRWVSEDGKMKTWDSVWKHGSSRKEVSFLFCFAVKVVVIYRLCVW